MKHIIKSLALLVLIGFSVSSCSEELEKFPQDQFATATFWESEENALLALAAVYRGSVNMNAGGSTVSDWWSWIGLINLDIASDNAYHGQGDNINFVRLSNGTLVSNMGILLNYWEAAYNRVARCNDFLENIGSTPMSEENKKRMIAEVKFIRACQYFYLSQHFGSVPLVTKTLSAEEANTVSKAPRQEVVDFVMAELTAAAADLPRFKDIPVSAAGRASKQAALAFLGRIQLAEKKFSDAANTYKTIIDFGDNIIDPQYSTLFIEANENSAENIFSIQYIPNLLANAVMNNNAPRIMGGFTFINPTASLMEAYQFTDGTPFSYTDARYDYRDIGKNRDPRLKYSIYYNNAPLRNGRYISHPDSTGPKYPDRIMNLNSKTGYVLRKYIDESVTGNLNTGNGGNMPIIRYAEVLLSYLEAKLEAGQPIDQALLDATINKVRGRTSVNMPPVNETNAALLRPILRNERRVELALEGIRYWDLLRWGIADQVLKGDFYGHPYPVSKVAIRKKSASTPADPYKRWYVTTRNFRKGVDEFWPIPQSEIDINPNLGK
ncbi:MAG: RagB/SusD family nutrient uptake outer membrane protein [Adhaeribacter sp.]